MERANRRPALGPFVQWPRDERAHADDEELDMIVVAQSPATTTSGASVFDEIAATHQQDASEYRLITQPDHARLSGVIATALDRDKLHYVSDEIVRGIANHDIGWS